jgi:hypothetical protein
MGNEEPCKLRYAGKTFRGKALLETSEILFRGETRLKIAFSSILEVQAQGGELHVRTSEGVAIFELGARAAGWREKIANPKTLVEKLGVKAGELVSLVGTFPPEFHSSLKKHGVEIAGNRVLKSSPWIFLAADSRGDLQRVNTLARSLQAAAAVWIVYPKGQKSITEGDVRSAGLKAGLVDIKVAGFSATHTALKFVIPKSKRQAAG